MPAPLRIVLLYSASHVGSAMILGKLLQSPDVQVVGIVRSPAFKGGREAARNYFKNLGWRFSFLLVWQRAVQALAHGLALLLSPVVDTGVTFPGWYLARKHKIPVLYTTQINGKAAVEFIQGKMPDVIVSAYYNRILKAPVITLPRLGVLNIHPGFLPAYKGVMSYFWALKNNEARAGVSVHWINEGIDTGDVIYKRTFAVHEKTTQHQVLIKTAVIGAWLILRALGRLRRGENLAGNAQLHDDASAYYSMPGQKDFDAYFTSRRFFRLRDIFAMVWRGIKRVAGR